MRDTDAPRAGAASVAIVADDLTGAADTGSGFASAGFSTIVTWPGSAADTAYATAEVVAIDAGSRIMDEAAAALATAAAVTSAREKSVATVYKKCDSLLRGHIGVEVAATLSAWHSGAIVIATFAFPAAGRTTVDGTQRIHGRDRAIPIVPVFERSGLLVRTLDLSTLRGPRATAVVRDSCAEGTNAFVFDAVTDDDLDTIVAVARSLARPIVWAGTGGLSRALARAHAAMASGHASREAPSILGPRQIMIVCASAASIAREQVSRVASAGADTIDVPAAALTGQVDEEARVQVLRSTGESLDRERDVVISLSHSPEENDHRVAGALGELLKPFATRVGGVAVTGGDTATALLRSWGIRALRLVGEIEAGVPVSISVGEPQLAIVTKAGAFGSPDVLVKARETLHKMVRVVA